ncbi:MAG TPA: carboxypeptidase M32 [Fibrobacteraceae bacterium]|nr:carboxypeptidase M32 [Fibrobacteraceae bacterium]
MPSRPDLLERIRGIYALRSALSLHGWDQETHMPSGAGETRAFVMAELAGRIHADMTDASFLSALEDGAQKADDPAEKACLQILWRDALRKSRVPTSLEKALVQASALSQQAWAEARSQRKTVAFFPRFQQLLHLKQQEADCLVSVGQSRYEGLLQSFEPGMTDAILLPVFATLESGLKDLLQHLQSQNRLRPPPAFPAIPIAQQSVYLQKLLPRIGFDPIRGCLDESAHPFTEGVDCDDVRLTVRYNENKFLDAYSSLMHEGGHGLYEQGFQKQWFFSPLAEAVSLGVHESQSRFWENCIGRSREYWEGELPRLHTAFPQLSRLALQDILAQVQAVHPSLIRVEADEVTYNLHILLRFRLERPLLSGDLTLSELENAWNSESKRLLGLCPGHPFEGFLQDVHWPAGLFGYFPTYTLGNLWAVQIWEAMRRDLPAVLENVRQSDLAPLRSWLREKIYLHGRRFDSPELMRRATGQDLDCDAFLAYLRNRYLS